MAKKQTRVSVNKLEKYHKRSQGNAQFIEASFQIDDDVVTYQVKPQLSLEECLRFINDVVSECVNANDDIFIPIAQKFIINKNILTYYGNFNMPDDIDKAFNLVMSAEEIIKAILSAININQYHMICDSIKESVEFEKQKMISVQEIRTSGVAAEMKQFIDRMSGLFDGVDGDQIASFVSGIAQMPNVTAEDLANAVVAKV